MQYLKIQNRGILPKKFFFLIGASTKVNDPDKIGEFGTGLKYAVAYFARHGLPLRVFVGLQEMKITTRPVTLKGITFKEIMINNKATSLTTDYGKDWEAWQVVREIWCNAIDTGDYKKEVVDGNKNSFAKARYTTFYIPLTETIKAVMEGWEDHFITDPTILYEDENIAIYPGSDKLTIYKNKIRIKQINQASIFHYDLKKAKLNELREYNGSLQEDIVLAVTETSEEVAKMFIKGTVEFIKQKKTKAATDIFVHQDDIPYELICDFGFYGRYYGNQSKVYDNFKGQLYISEDSTDKFTGGLRIPNRLLTYFSECGLKTRTINRSASYGGYGVGGSYSGGGSSIGKEIDYEEIPNAKLETRIGEIVKKYDLSMSFGTMSPVAGDPVDIALKGKDKVLFNVDLTDVENKELTAVVLTSYALTHNPLYLVAKRLMKRVVNYPKIVKMILGIGKKLEDGSEIVRT